MSASGWLGLGSNEENRTPPAPERPISPEIQRSTSPVYRYARSVSPVTTVSEFENNDSDAGDESDSSDSGEVWCVTHMPSSTDVELNQIARLMCCRNFTNGDIDGATVGSGKLTIVEDAKNHRVFLKINGTDTTTLQYWCKSYPRTTGSPESLP